MRFAARVALAIAMCLMAVDGASGGMTLTPGKPDGAIWCRWTTEPVKVDGRLQEWAKVNFQVAMNAAHVKGNTRYQPHIVGGDADCSASVAVRWNGEFLYLAARVRDDVVAPVNRDGGYGKPWQHDGLMFYLHAHPGLVATGRVDAGHSVRINDARRCLGLSCYQAGYQPRELPGRSRYAARKTDAGYVLEAMLDLPALGYRRPLAGDRLKMTMFLVDCDPGVAGPDAFGQLLWQFGPNSERGAPGYWADLRLLRDGWGVDLAASVEGTGTRRRLRLKGILDAVDADVALKGIRVLDKDGHVVRELKMSRLVPKGERLAITADADAAEWADGVYTLHAAAEVNGQRKDSGPSTRVRIAGHRTRTQPPATVKLDDPTRYYFTADKYRPPTLEKVDKDSYLAFLVQHIPAMFQSPPSADPKPNRMAHLRGFIAAYMYHATKAPFYAKQAKTYLEAAIRYSEGNFKRYELHIHWHYLMVKYMRASGLIDKKAEPRIRKFLITSSRQACWGHYGWKDNPWRRGAGHSALGPAAARYYALHTYPDHIPADEAKLWKKYFDLTWGDWWTHRDTIYNDTGYRALFLSDVFHCAFLTGRKDLFTDPEAKKLWQRLLWATAPNGALPHHGDAGNWNTAPGSYLFFMEALAANTRDGQYKHAAHRIFDQIVNHSVNIDDYYHIRQDIVTGVLFAHMVADDSVKPVAPPQRSVVLFRKEPLGFDHATDKLDFGYQVYTYVLSPKSVPDKIVFKSSNHPDALWAMIDLCPDAGHNQISDVTNVAGLVDKESVLLCNQGYYDEGPQWHNVILADDLEGIRLQDAKMTIALPEFYDRSAASYARVRVGNYQGWPIDEERQFLFGRNRFLLVKDVVTFKQDWMCRIGPCWHTQQLGPEIGPNWANLHIDHLYASGGGNTGGGVYRWKNPAWDLLVFHPPKKDCHLEVVNRYQESIFRMTPVRTRYAWRGMAEKGKQLHWTSLLMTHKPVADPSQFVKNIEVLVDTLPLTGMKTRTVLGNRVWTDWMVLNDTGKTVTAGDVETDARQVHLYVFTNYGKVKQQHVMAEGGTFVKFRGKEIARVKKGMKIDKQF